MEFESITVTMKTCDNNGSIVEKSATVPVIKGVNGSTANLYTVLFDSILEANESICSLAKKLEAMDLCVGIPMRGYETDTGDCVVLYFNDARSTKQGIGRYIQLPYAHHQKIIEWGNTDPIWKTGSWYTYLQFMSSQGPKISCFSLDEATAKLQLETLQSLLIDVLPPIYHLGKPRLVASKQELVLRLKRVTYFPSGLEKAGRQPGQVIFTNTK